MINETYWIHRTIRECPSFWCVVSKENMMVVVDVLHFSFFFFFFCFAKARHKTVSIFFRRCRAFRLYFVRVQWYLRLPLVQFDETKDFVFFFTVDIHQVGLFYKRWLNATSSRKSHLFVRICKLPNDRVVSFIIFFFFLFMICFTFSGLFYAIRSFVLQCLNVWVCVCVCIWEFRSHCKLNIRKH